MKLDVLAIGSHPDDVELGCGATLALLSQRGLDVGILHLTRHVLNHIVVNHLNGGGWVYGPNVLLSI